MLVLSSIRAHSRGPRLCEVESPPTSALPRASTSFAWATDNSLDCPLNASRPTAKPIEHKLLTFKAKQNCRSQPCYFLHKQSIALRGDIRRSRRVLPLIMPLCILDGKANRMSKMLVLSVPARHSNRPRHCEVGSVFERASSLTGTSSNE